MYRELFSAEFNLLTFFKGKYYENPKVKIEISRQDNQFSDLIDVFFKFIFKQL